MFNQDYKTQMAGGMPVETLRDFLSSCFMSKRMPNRLGVALSGGPDSMALLLSLLQWREMTKTTIDIVPLIVDHGLRSESSQEVRYVVHLTQQWGLEPRVMRWERPLGEAVISGVMAAARQARYRLIAHACLSERIEHVLFGHHADDMLETAWMRSQDHVPWYAKAGMSCAVYRLGFWILRPWLRLPKQVLKDWLKSQLGGEEPWLEDPTNHRMCFARSQARKDLTNWSSGRLIQAQKTLSDCGQYKQERMAKLSQTIRLSRYVAALRIHNMSCLMDGLQAEDGVWLVQSWLSAFTFRSWPRLGAISSFWHRLQEAFGSVLQMPSYRVIGSFGGCMWVQCRHEVWIFREYQALLNQHVAETRMLWDDRVFGPSSCLTLNKRDDTHGPWRERLQRITLPKEWRDNALTEWQTVWCGWPWPQFWWKPTVLADPVPVEWDEDKRAGVSGESGAAEGTPLSSLIGPV